VNPVYVLAYGFVVRTLLEWAKDLGWRPLDDEGRTHGPKLRLAAILLGGLASWALGWSPTEALALPVPDWLRVLVDGVVTGAVASSEHDLLDWWAQK
jgi:hypothetical protein